MNQTLGELESSVFNYLKVNNLRFHSTNDRNIKYLFIDIYISRNCNANQSEAFAASTQQFASRTYSPIRKI